MGFRWVAAAMIACATGAAAQERVGDPVLAIRWIGDMHEPGGEPSRYRLRVDISLDRHSAYVGTVRYGTLDCAGVWLRPQSSGVTTRFEEVITDDPEGRCATQMDVELERAGNGLVARFRRPGEPAVIATARLRPWIWPTTVSPENPVPDRE